MPAIPAGPAKLRYAYPARRHCTDARISAPLTLRSVIGQWGEVALCSVGCRATSCYLLILRPVVQMPFRTIRNFIRKAVSVIGW
jgi:hypothetical protein